MRHIKNNWYGIAGLKFVWHGEWSDPCVIYKGKELNIHPCVDTMWDRYNEECLPPSNYKSEEYREWEQKFDNYMFENQEDVKELLDMYFDTEE